MGDSSAAWPVPSADIRRRRLDLWGLPVLLVVVAVVLTAIGLYMRAHERAG